MDVPTANYVAKFSLPVYLFICSHLNHQQLLSGRSERVNFHARAVRSRDAATPAPLLASATAEEQATEQATINGERFFFFFFFFIVFFFRFVSSIARASSDAEVMEKMSDCCFFKNVR
jgi:hypothetical protein